MEASKSDKAENMSFASWLKMNHPKQAKQDVFSLKVLSMLLLKSKAVHSRILQIKDIGEIESLIEKFRINKGINIYILETKKLLISPHSAHMRAICSICKMNIMRTMNEL